MAIHPGTRSSTRPATREAQVLKRLVEARVEGPYAPFFVSGEGTFFPNGVEETSGFVLDHTGTVYSFWTGWADSSGGVGFAQWEQVDAEPAWLESEEYRRALDAVGLS